MIIFCSYRKSLWENGQSKSNNFSCSTFGWPQLECFQNIFESSANVEGIGILFAVCDSCLADKAAFSILRNHDDRQKTRQWWKRVTSISTHRPLFCCENEGNIVEDHYFDNQILQQGFSSMRKMTHKSFLLEYKISLLNILQWATCFVPAIQRFIQTSLRCSFFGIRNDKVLFSFTKCIVLEYKLKLSNFGRLLLHEFVCTIYSYWFRPKVATIETTDIFFDICFDEIVNFSSRI